MNEEEIAIADLDLELLDTARTTGDVRNWHDRSKSAWSINGSL